LTFQGGILVPGYSASKGGIGQLTKALANEWASHGVSVNAIAPGYIATDNTAALRADEARNTAILERIPAGRWGNPDDLKGAVLFLSSSASDYVHGETEMLPKSRMIAALEHRNVDRVPVGEIGVDYTITERALGHETLYRAKWKEYQAYWQGRRDEIVESYKRDIVALARKFEWDF
jgi:hypothetical protein